MLAPPTYESRVNNGITTSRIQGHHVDPRSDRLYDPLRQVLTNQYLPSHHASITPIGARNSTLSHEYRILNTQDVDQLNQETLIPINRPLAPTDDLRPVRGKNFMVVDTQQKIVGPPITPQQMERIRLQGVKRQQVRYDFGSNKRQIIETVDEVRQIQPKNRYRGRTIQDDGDAYLNKRHDYKYNLYSSIDQGVNGCREGKGCSFGPNECIASRNKPQSMNWFSS